MLKHKSNLALLILLLLVFGVSVAGAQIPEKFENLQILPKDISRGELIGEMRSMAGGLGLRCHDCHLGEPGNSLEGFDFVSDEKQLKKTARVMMRMVEEINSELLPKIGKERSQLVAVRCVTCHHGQTRPRTLQQVLAEEIETNGVEAAVARYHELREKYYGGHTFDFTEWRLLNLAETLGRDGKPEAARRFLELNVEVYPEFGITYAELGRLQQKAGDKERALRSYTKALELMPENAARLQSLIDGLSESMD